MPEQHDGPTADEKGLILITGGAGYIGSHTVVALHEAGYRCVVLDNLANSSSSVLGGIAKIIGTTPDFVEADVADTHTLDQVFESRRIDAVIHLAGLKSVGESVSSPLDYYSVNLESTLSLLRSMHRFECHTLLFSSSAAVYAPGQESPITETAAIQPTSPYGRSKQMIEQILVDTAASDDRWRVGLLRCFNPVGTHPSGSIGESPGSKPNNLMPSVMDVAAGRGETLRLFGDDYPTPDGTCIRDYIHVMDIARGIVAGLQRVRAMTGTRVWNLGTGRGTSVRELVSAAEEATGVEIPTSVTDRRPGDQPVAIAAIGRAQHELSWDAEHDVATMCDDHWRWHRLHAAPATTASPP
ncbi:MAG: UDP-glucose 4-epimerase GalE [Actinomycetia bacterium]|nr:UDP-glucose 4-epimerase GalE [Actinomycetes bacterium]MCP4959186.1 UDP-glucose 4-epimerase GalE [Actinomycetes bacterium]